MTMNGNNLDDNIYTVSYTHLDVYKRQPYLSKCDNIFIRARNVSDRKIFTDNTILNKDDERIKSFPFTTSRPTVLELKRAWCELSYLKILPRPEPVAIKETVQKLELSNKKEGLEEKQELSPEEIQTEELISLVKKGRAPLLISFIKKNKLDGNFRFCLLYTSRCV